MFYKFSKIAVCVATLASTGLVLATDPYLLGWECAKNTIWGIRALVNGSGKKTVSYFQQIVSNCVSEVKELKDEQERRSFLESGRRALQEETFQWQPDIFSGWLQIEPSYSLEHNRRQAQISMAKFAGIEILSKVLTRLDSVMLHEPLEPLFTGLPFESRNEMIRAFVRAAIRACREANCLELDTEESIYWSEDSIVNCIDHYNPELNTLPTPARLAIDFMYGDFGDKIAEFVYGAHLFAQA